MQPDYFANRKLVQFFGGEVVPVQIDYMKSEASAGLDLDQLREAFASGVKVFLFSNPNNPTGAAYSAAEIAAIAKLAAEFDVMVIADQLYSRLRYDGATYTHLRATGLKVRAPQAGSYLFPEFPPLDVSLNDFVRLLRVQAGVTVTSGSEFGPHWSSVRLNFSQDHAAAVAAGQRIVEMVGRYGQRTTSDFRQYVSWLQQ